MHPEIRSRAISFKHAFAGYSILFKTQKNALIHAFATLLALIIGFLVKLNALEWAVLILVIGGVWTAELFNTAVEAILDRISPEYHPLVKTAKDVAAAAVLTAALVSLIAGILLFGKPLIHAILILMN